MPNSKRGGILKVASKNELRVLEMLRRGFDAKAIAYELELNVATVYGVMKRNGFRSAILSPQELDMVARHRFTHAATH